MEVTLVLSVGVVRAPRFAGTGTGTGTGDRPCKPEADKGKRGGILKQKVMDDSRSCIFEKSNWETERKRLLWDVGEILIIAGIMTGGGG